MANAANMGTASADKMGNNVNIGTAATNMGTVASATMATSAANDRLTANAVWKKKLPLIYC